MEHLILQPTAAAHWHALVNEAESAADCPLDEDLESYLVFMLMRFVSKPDVLAGVLALDYLEGMMAPGSERCVRLRDVGDQCLLVSGLFPQRAQRRRVKISYYIELGRGAYRELGESARANIGQIYAQISRYFVELMDVLQAMRTLDQAQVGLQPLEAYELWQETGSRRAARALQELAGGQPVALVEPGTKSPRKPH